MVYRNLTKQCWSIKNVRTGIVVGHADELFLCDVDFKVSSAGRDRVLRERKKYVHAGVYGMCCYPIGDECSDIEWSEVRYNPYKYSQFVGAFDVPVHKAKYAFLDRTGLAYYSNAS